MKLKVPITKDPEFSISLLNTISNAIGELMVDHGKLPDVITFSGTLGREIFDFIEHRDWNLDKFNPKLVNDRFDQITIQYSKPLDQITDNHGATLDAPLNGKIVKGLVGPEVMQKVLGAYSTPSFKIERKINPSLVINLHR